MVIGIFFGNLRLGKQINDMHGPVNGSQIQAHTLCQEQDTPTLTITRIAQ
jgi:hypothetical protein